MHIEYAIYSLKQNYAFSPVEIAIYLTHKSSGYSKRAHLHVFVTGAEQLIQWEDNILR